MAARKPRPPAYRHRTIRGYEYAVVTLTDGVSGRRRDYGLGEYGSPYSRTRYAKLLATWEAAGRRLPHVDDIHTALDPTRTIATLCRRYRDHVAANYGASHRASVDMVIGVLANLYAGIQISEFGPNALRSVRAAMLRPDGDRKAWSPGTAQKATRLIVGMFKWGVAHELIEARYYEAIRTVEPLRGVARRTVKPVALATVVRTLRHLGKPVRAMVRLQLATGMRPGEVIAMRPCDINMADAVWTYRPPAHKTAWRGLDREIQIGPRGQRILRAWLRMDVNAPLFPYTVAGYRRAVTRAADRANVAALAAAGGEIAGRLVPRWHPHQLRHTYATLVRSKFGLEAAQLSLGHSSALVTDAVYAERDQRKAAEIARMIG